MKIRSLLLGSIAAAGLTTGAFAADPVQVLTTLNLCDALGLTGLTISSDNNCLQITGEVKYEFNWGDYKGSQLVAATNTASGYDAFTIMDNDSDPVDRDQDWGSKVETYLKFVGTADTDVGPAKATIKLKDIQENQVRNENNLARNQVADATFNIFINDPAAAAAPPANLANVLAVNPGSTPGAGRDGILDTADDVMRSAGVDGKLGTADDQFLTRTGAGATPAAPFVLLNNGADGVLGTDDDLFINTLGDANPDNDIVLSRRAAIDDYSAVGDTTASVILDEAYVSIGGATVLSAGKKGSILNYGDDTPFNWLGLFLSDKVDAGVKWRKDVIKDGGQVIQLVHDFGNGLSGGVGLEQLNATGAAAGTAVGVLAYAGEKVTAHVSVAANGFLDGTLDRWGVHAGITGTFNILKVRAAVAADSTSTSTYVNALASAQATFDIFTLAWSGEYSDVTSDALNNPDYGAGASAGFKVTDGVTINVGGRWYHDGETMDDGFQVAGQIVAAVTETVTVTGEVGVYGLMLPGDPTDVYGKVILAWAPGGGFTSSLTGEVHQNGAYRATFKAGKTID